MYRETHRERGGGTGAAAGGTDWQALEVQLTRTRLILQEILVHLQDVLRNLKMARAASSGFASSARSEGARHSTQARAGERVRSQTSSASSSSHGFRARPTAGTTGARTSASGATGARPSAAGASPTGQSGTTAGSERFRARPRAGTESRTETGPGRASGSTGRTAGTHTTTGRTTANERPRAEESRFRTSARAGAESAGRERPRSENTYHTRPGASAGTDREHSRAGAAGAQESARASQSQGASASSSASASGATNARTHARTSSRASGFSMDGERQRRARETARKGGMNLKCAYDILCLDYPCSADDIKVAYRQMARLHHPDLGGDEEVMKDVNVAYELAMRFCAGPRRANTAWAV